MNNKMYELWYKNSFKLCYICGNGSDKKTIRAKILLFNDLVSQSQMNRLTLN